MSRHISHPWCDKVEVLQQLMNGHGDLWCRLYSQRWLSSRGVHLPADLFLSIHGVPPKSLPRPRGPSAKLACALLTPRRLQPCPATLRCLSGLQNQQIGRNDWIQRWLDLRHCKASSCCFLTHGEGCRKRFSWDTFCTFAENLRTAFAQSLGVPRGPSFS